jgi:hypothetical protein
MQAGAFKAAYFFHEQNILPRIGNPEAKQNTAENDIITLAPVGKVQDTKTSIQQ